MYTTTDINKVINNGNFNLIESNAEFGSFGEYINDAEMIYFSERDNHNRNYYKKGEDFFLVISSKDLKSISLYGYNYNN